MPDIVSNPNAKRDFHILETFEAGIVLRGTEVKACRAGQAQIHEAYVQVLEGEAFLMNSHISEYTQGNRHNHVPERQRKLLMHKKEIDRLEVDTRQKGQSAVPLQMYFKEGRAKIEIGVGTGKGAVDRRQDIKERETRREMERALRSRHR
jgi:SsrA-binding protein